MCGAVYEVLVAPVGAGVWNIVVGIPPLKREKEDLVKGYETRV